MKILVVNALNTSDKTPPAGYASWIDFWNSKKGLKATKCRNCGKQTSDLVGSHVQHVREEGGKYYRVPGLYITPLCYECNHPENDKAFWVDSEDLVSVL